MPQLLVRAGLALLDEDGPEGLTLRRVCGRAGVSHAAPAHHFGGLPGLRAAIATQGFRSLSQDLLDARDAPRADADPYRSLLAVNLAYIRFAHHRTALFRLMFEEIPTTDDDLRAAARTSYLLMQKECLPFAKGRDAASLVAAVWALTHGFAMLKLDKPYPPGSPVQAAPYEDALRLLVG